MLMLLPPPYTTTVGDDFTFFMATIWVIVNDDVTVSVAWFVYNDCCANTLVWWALLGKLAV